MDGELRGEAMIHLVPIEFCRQGLYCLILQYVGDHAGTPEYRRVGFVRGDCKGSLGKTDYIIPGWIDSDLPWPPAELQTIRLI